MKKFRCLWLVAILTALPALAQDYEIRLSRPIHVGQKFDFSVVGTERGQMRVWVNRVERELVKRDLTLSLKSVATLEAVRSDGICLRESHKVVEFYRIQNGVRKELLTNGAVVVAWNEGTNRLFEVDGARAHGELKESLDRVMRTIDDGSRDDEVFGTKERKKPGQSWKFDKEKIAKTFEREEHTPLANASGKGTLKKILQEKDGPVALIVLEFEGKPQANFFPVETNDSVTKKASLHMKITSKCPLDTSLQPIEFTAERDFSADGAQNEKLKDWPLMEMSLNLKQTMTRTLKELKD